MSLFESASLVVTPNGTKASKLYSVKPDDGSGDMTVTRATTATRVNSSGIIESVATNIPRLDYTNSTCPSILIEPQRTNLALRSEEFDNASWAKTNSTITANSVISPDGTQDADTFIANGATGIKNITGTISILSQTAYSFSVFAKKNTNNFIQLVGSNTGFGANFWANFDLNNGVLGSKGSGVTSKIENYGNGWYRCTISGTSAIYVGAANNILSICTSATSGRLESNSLSTSVYIWGAQLEAGANSTSYIPTTTASITRNADNISRTGISSLIGQTEGVLFVESAALANDLISKGISISDGTLSNRIVLRYNNDSNQILVFGTVNGTGFSSTILYNLSDITQFSKIAIRYKANDITLWVNGVLRGTLTSQSLPINLSRFGFDSGDSSNPFFAKVKQAQLYKIYLTNAEMTALTTI